MSEDRLVSSRELACAFRNIAMSYATDAMNTDGAERVLNEYAYEVAKNIAEGLESGKIGLTVDAVPVVHAFWHPAFDPDYSVWRCTKCGYAINTSDHMVPGLRYCPNCGAKMDGGGSK